MKLIKTYGFGYDFGNAETCGVVSGNGASMCIVSAIAQGSREQLDRLGVKFAPDHFVFRGNDSTTEQFVGNLALEQSAMSFSGRGDVARYWSEKSRVMLLTVASLLIPDKEFALSVVTGLPVQTYLGDTECRQRIKGALNGTHVFSVNGYARTVHVDVNRVIMEGAGAAIAYAQDDGLLGVVDIGGRTTDLYVARGQKPLMHKCAGKALGVEIAGDLLSENFQRQHGRPLTILEVREILRAYIQDKTLPRIMARGMPVSNLNLLVNEALEQIGDEIVSFVSSQWNESEAGSEVASSMSTVLSIGGGTRYFFPQLQELIPHAQFVDVPEQANAHGYALFAEQTLKPSRAVS